MYKSLKIVLAVLAIGTSVFGFGQSKVSIIKGHNSRLAQGVTGEVILSRPSDGNLIKVTSAFIDTTHEFMLSTIVDKEGFYYLADKSHLWTITIYLKPGENIELNCNSRTNYDLISGSEENKVLHEWTVLSLPITCVVKESNAYINNKELTFSKYVSNYTEVLPKLESFGKNIHTSNPVFNEWMPIYIKEQLELAAYASVTSPVIVNVDPVTRKPVSDSSNPKVPKAELFKPFLTKFIEDKKFCDARLLQLGDGMRLIMNYITAKSMMMSAEEKKTYLSKKPAEQVQQFCNDTIKGVFLLTKFAAYRGYDAIKADIDPVKKYLVTDRMKDAYDKKLKSLYKNWLLKGEQGMNFKLEDNFGKTVSMEDFKGKLVYVDIWATWCAPCKAEIPYLKKTEEKFKDRNIVFVSVTIDKESDKKKWLEMIDKEKLGGVQLFGGQGCEFQKYYNATTIPRFLLFDEEGKIISVTASRPSNPDLDKQLTELLSK